MEVFQCNWGSSLKSFLSARNQDKLYLQIDDTKADDVKIKVKAYICNEDGKNEYVAESDFSAKEIRDVKKGEFQGSNALIIVTRLQTLYGVKKTASDGDPAPFPFVRTDVRTDGGGVRGQYNTSPSA